MLLTIIFTYVEQTNTRRTLGLFFAPTNRLNSDQTNETVDWSTIFICGDDLNWIRQSICFVRIVISSSSSQTFRHNIYGHVQLQTTFGRSMEFKISFFHAYDKYRLENLLLVKSKGVRILYQFITVNSWNVWFLCRALTGANQLHEDWGDKLYCKEHTSLFQPLGLFYRWLLLLTGNVLL